LKNCTSTTAKPPSIPLLLLYTVQCLLQNDDAKLHDEATVFDHFDEPAWAMDRTVVRTNPRHRLSAYD